MGGERGWERPPLRSTIYGPGIRAYASPSATGPGSLPARACGASDPCGKATNPPARRVEEAAGDGSGRRVVLAADTGIEPPLTEAAHDLVARLQGVGEPVGLRLAEGGLARPQDAGGDHNGAPLSRERTHAGVRGRRPRPPVAPAAAREAGGPKGGAASPRQSQCTHIGSAGLPAVVALVTAVTRAHGGAAVVMPPPPRRRSRPGTWPIVP